jgi:hypothetical protein
LAEDVLSETGILAIGELTLAFPDEIGAGVWVLENAAMPKMELGSDVIRTEQVQSFRPPAKPISAGALAAARRRSQR